MFLRARNTRSNTPWLLAAVTAAWITVPHARGVVIDQIDDFQDSTTQGWGIGAGPQPEIMTDGGPLGAGDRFTMMTADGSSSGGRLTVFNRSQWLGDYIAAGVTAVQIDLRNFGLLRGTTHWMGLTGSASEAIEIHGYQINASEASAQRR